METKDRELMRARSITVKAILITHCVAIAPLSSSVRAQEESGKETPAAESPAKDVPETSADKSDPYTPPETDDAATIQKFVEDLSKAYAPDRTPAGILEHFTKLERAADALMARDVEEAGLLEVIRLKVGALGILEQLGDTAAPKRKQEFVAKLMQDERPAIAVHGRLLDIEGRIDRFQPGDATGAQQLIDEVVTLLQEKPLTDAHIAVAYAVAEKLDAEVDAKLATSAYRVFAKYLKASGNTEYATLAATFEGSARRLNLEGNSVKIGGTTLEEESFDISQWKGKVVLVDFWATWCVSCLAEMPNLKALYNKHHAAGFEIVGVNLDDNIGRAGALVRTQNLQWPHLVSDKGMESEIAVRYGVYSLPTTFLVGRDGKVAAIDLFGDELAEKVSQLMKAGTDE